MKKEIFFLLICNISIVYAGKHKQRHNPRRTLPPLPMNISAAPREQALMQSFRIPHPSDHRSQTPLAPCPNALDESGNSAVHRAVMERDLEALNAALSNPGANPNLEN